MVEVSIALFIHFQPGLSGQWSHSRLLPFLGLQRGLLGDQLAGGFLASGPAGGAGVGGECRRVCCTVNDIIECHFSALNPELDSKFAHLPLASLDHGSRRTIPVK